MKQYERIIFVGKGGSSREPMAMGIMQDFGLDRQIEILARGLVVLFPEPINQKAEAVLISNGITLGEFSSVQLSKEDLTERTLILAMDTFVRGKVLEQFPQANPEDVQVLTEYVGDELEIIDPYGGTLQVYGLCYETLRKSIKKLVMMINGGDYYGESSDHGSSVDPA